MPTVFHVFDIIKAVHEVMTAKALAGPSSSMAAWVDPAAMYAIADAAAVARRARLCDAVCLYLCRVGGWWAQD